MKFTRKFSNSELPTEFYYVLPDIFIQPDNTT